MRWHVGFFPDGAWWELRLWRLDIDYRPCALTYHKYPGLDEAPGVWIFNFGAFSVRWWRRWIVWGNHPYRWENIQRYDQFGTFAATTRRCR